MAFNHAVLVAAIVIGLAAGIAGATSKPDQKELVRALGVGLLGSAIAGVVVVAVIGVAPFALIHLIYLVFTAGVPIAAVLILVRSRNLSNLVKGVLGVAVLGLPIGLYASHVEPFWLRVDRVALGVPANEAGLRIGVLSDLQTTEVGDYENDAVNTLLAEEPDLIVVPGDLWQLDFEGLQERGPEFTALLARIGEAVPHVFIVNGDTDNVRDLRTLAAGTSAVVLDNEVVEVVVKGIPVRIGGISHLGDDSRRPATIEQLMSGSDDAFRLLLAHRPGVINLLPEGAPIDLVVSGHTHGGQIAIPYVGPLITLSEVPRSVGGGGLHLLNGYPIYVSTGVGRERQRAPQVRFGVRPSVGIITTR